jgi:hypothetical protein
MVQLSASKCSCIATLWVSLVSFTTMTLCVASKLVFISLSTQSGNFWTHPRIRVFTLYISYKCIRNRVQGETTYDCTVKSFPRYWPPALSPSALNAFIVSPRFKRVSDYLKLPVQQHDLHEKYRAPWNNSMEQKPSEVDKSRSASQGILHLL